MASSPPKRRKTSPIPDAPITPSRIPRPSFASPTKSSIARHNPQLLTRLLSAGTGARRPGSRGKVQGSFEALAETQLGTDGTTIRGEERLQTASTPFRSQDARILGTPSALMPRNARAAGGGFSAKPRRRSQSPVKQFGNEQVERAFDAMVQEHGEGIDSFQKKGLRRSPTGSQAQEGNISQDNMNPFKKTGLRRSPPVPSEAMEPLISTMPDEPPVPEPTTQVLGRRISPRLEEAAKPRNVSMASESIDFMEHTEPSVSRPATRGSDFGISPRSKEAAEQRNVSMVEEPIASAERSEPRIPQTITQKSGRRTSPRLIETAEQRNTASEEQAASKVACTQEVPETIRDSKTQETQPRGSDVSQEPTQSNNLPQKKKTRQARLSQQEEPELPPTPTQRGIADPIVTTPPSGIHDTPSKRARRSKALSAKLKSSPLKPREAPPPEPVKEAVPVPEARIERPPKRRKSARFSFPVDPHAEKKKARDDLLKELQQLQADVALTNRENERLRLHHESKATKPPKPPNPDELLVLLLRSTAPESKFQPESRPSLFKSIGSFLPFSASRKPHSIEIPTLSKAPSHAPIKTDDPLPHLQLFSALKYTSTVTALPASPTTSFSSTSEESPSLLQTHQITASHPSDLFISRLSMTIDTSIPSIQTLSADRIDPASEPELGSFVRSRASDDSPFGKDIIVVCWAMSRWAEVSIIRARFWCAVDKEFATPEARMKSLARLKHARVGRKRKRSRVIEDDEDDEVGGQEEERENGKGKWTRRELLPHMGRTSMEIWDEEEKVELRIGWKIGFDWTGEVESDISAGVRLPLGWQESDDRESLTKIPEMFDRMIKDRGPLNAVRAVVGLLMTGSS